MSDLIRLEHSVAPWLGSHDALPLAEYRYYDIPTLGIVRQGTQQYLYWCATRPDESPTVWLYSAVTEAERAEIEAGGADGFNERVSDLPLHGWGMIALATENIGIVDFVEVELSSEGIRAAYDQLLARLDTLAQDARQHAATLSSR